MPDTPINPTVPPLPPPQNPGETKSAPTDIVFTDDLGRPTISVQVDDVPDPKPVNPNDPWPDKAAEGVFLMVYWKLRGWGVNRWFSWLISGAAGVAVGIVAYILSAAIWAWQALAPDVGFVMLKGISEARKSIDPAMPQLGAEVLTELTGANITAGHLPQGKTFADHLARVTALGSELHDLLEKEFVPHGTITPEQGATAARAFTGFNINFGIGTAFIALMGELESLGKLEQFRELGVEVARNLGLGRLHRLALTPLIKTTLADPYLHHLQAKYRTARLPKEKLIQAYFRGAVTEQAMLQELAEDGWSDEKIKDLLTDARPNIGEREVVHLFFSGILNETAMRIELGKRGLDASAISLIVEVERPKTDKAEILRLYEFGQINRDDTLARLGKLGYDSTNAEDIVIGFEMQIQAVPRPKPIRHKARTFQQLRKEFLDGVIDLLELQTALSQAGYGDDDISAMVQDILVDQAHRKTTGAAHALPHLSWAQIKEAYKAGILDLIGVEAHLKARGYTQADLAVLLKELPAPPPPPALPTP